MGEPTLCETEFQTRDASGGVLDSSALVAFLYLLARDHITIGELEGAVRDAEKTVGLECLYSNGWLAQYAQHLAERLTPEDVEYQPDPDQVEKILVEDSV